MKKLTTETSKDIDENLWYEHIKDDFEDKDLEGDERSPKPIKGKRGQKTYIDGDKE